MFIKKLSSRSDYKCWRTSDLESDLSDIFWTVEGLLKLSPFYLKSSWFSSKKLLLTSYSSCLLLLFSSPNILNNLSFRVTDLYSFLLFSFSYYFLLSIMIFDDRKRLLLVFCCSTALDKLTVTLFTVSLTRLFILSIYLLVTFSFPSIKEQEEDEWS